MKMKLFFFMLIISFPLSAKQNITEDSIVVKTSNDTASIRLQRAGLMK